MRTASIARNTKETGIEVSFNLDGSGENNLKTGIGFFDHLIDQLCFYSGIDISGTIEGDLYIDNHHTLEDLGYVLGNCLNDSLGEKKGIERFSSQYIPMDETLVRSILDISGRPFLHFEYNFQRERIGELETECIKEFLRAFVTTAKITIHIDVIRGENNHHIAEAIFKAIGRSLACGKIVKNDVITSTKGVI